MSTSPSNILNGQKSAENDMIKIWYSSHVKHIKWPKSLQIMTIKIWYTNHVKYIKCKKSADITYGYCFSDKILKTTEIPPTFEKYIQE